MLSEDRVFLDVCVQEQDEGLDGLNKDTIYCLCLLVQNKFFVFDVEIDHFLIYCCRRVVEGASPALIG